MSAVPPSIIGAAVLAVMLAAGWVIGGVVARELGEPSPDVDDRAAAFVLTVALALVVAGAALATYSVGNAILDALR